MDKTRTHPAYPGLFPYCNTNPPSPTGDFVYAEPCSAEEEADRLCAAQQDEADEYFQDTNQGY